MERQSPFGCNCPDPDSPWPDHSFEWVHGCVLTPFGMPACSEFEYVGVPAAWITREYFVTNDNRMWYIPRNGPVVLAGINNQLFMIDGQNLTVKQWAWRAWHGEDINKDNLDAP